MLGAMLITFLYLTQTEKGTALSKDSAITALIIAATYVAVIGYGETSDVMNGSPYNPAAAFGLFWAIAFHDDVDNTYHTWMFFFFAYFGSLLAVILFECLYKRASSQTKTPEYDTIADEKETDDHAFH